eukprot:Gregarina_sp_Pseudo_9__1600@NODE_2078_length_1163_cov_7_701068_g1919_i0_p1_GENE_NODE_2078_length_1163_cov_7_701068_g1919_i0NODE_2078_length_1163_cov_7_701068_g1919_i0_p1_ORF_typecomplete_len283_score6_94_NODE_2078_length_1163_cov_7_701068_g1919_i02111059
MCGRGTYGCAHTHTYTVLTHTSDPLQTVVLCVLGMKTQYISRLVHIWNSLIPFLAYTALLAFWENLFLNLRQLGRIALSSGSVHTGAGICFWAVQRWIVESTSPGPPWDEHCPFVHRTLGCIRPTWTDTPLVYLSLGIIELTLLCCLLVTKPMLMTRYIPFWGVTACTLLACTASSITVLLLGGSAGLILTSCIMAIVAHLPVGSPWWFELMSTTPSVLMGVVAVCILCVIFDTFCVLERNLNAVFAIVCTLLACISSIGSNLIAAYTIDVTSGLQETCVVA